MSRFKFLDLGIYSFTAKTFMLGPYRFRLPVFGANISNHENIRVVALDGLRGWAALSVVCFHLLWETFGRVDPLLRNPFTAFMLDGSLAVSLFFVLSGEALSSAYFAGGGRRAVASLAIKRYPRLFIPVLAASAITALIVHAHANSNAAAGDIVERSEWLGAWVGFAPSILGTLRFALFDVFTDISPSESLVPFLWTMRLELAGSVLVFTLLLLAHGRRYGWHMALTAFVALMAIYLARRQADAGNLACFIVGMVCAKLRIDGFFDRAKARPGAFVISAGAINALLAVDSIMQGESIGSMRGPLFAMLLVILISCNDLAEHLFSTPLSRFLGRISFPIFLIQFPVIISLTSWLIVRAGDQVKNPGVAFIIFATSLAVCMIAAVLFAPIERFTKMACQAWYKGIMTLIAQRYIQLGLAPLKREL